MKSNPSFLRSRIASILLAGIAAVASLGLTSCTTEEGVLLGALSGAAIGGVVGHADEEAYRHHRHYDNGYYQDYRPYRGGYGGGGYDPYCGDGYGW